MNDQTNEQEAVRTTIVGGGPPGSGRSNVAVPRGIEVLLKKAAVDPEFRQLLLHQRGSAAAAIELELATSEKAILNAIPPEQLVSAIAHTLVPAEQRRVFLGRVAAAMLAVLGVGLAGCEPRAESAGARPTRPAPDPAQTNQGSNGAPAPPLQPGAMPTPSQASSNNTPSSMPQPLSRGIGADRP